MHLEVRAMATRVCDLRDRAEVWLAAPVEQPNGETDYCYTKSRTIWGGRQPDKRAHGDADR